LSGSPNKFKNRNLGIIAAGFTFHPHGQALSANHRQFDTTACQAVRELSAMSLDFPDFLRGVRFALSLQPGAEMMTVEKNPTLRRKSMELLKELTQILQEIIGSGDEESLRRLEETVRALGENRRKTGRTLH